MNKVYFITSKSKTIHTGYRFCREEETLFDIYTSILNEINISEQYPKRAMILSLEEISEKKYRYERDSNRRLHSYK